LYTQDLFLLEAEEWEQLIKECRILDPLDEASGKAEGRLDMRACKHVFFIAASEDSGDGHEKDPLPFNPNAALTRCEFLEAVVRLALAKYLPPSGTPSPPGMDAAEAVLRLLEHDILPVVPPEASLDCSHFRVSRLFTRPMESLLEKHQRMLQTVYECYSGALKRLHLPQLLLLMQHVGLLDVKGEGMLTARGIQLCFCWSRTFAKDDLIGRDQYVSLSFTGFLECFARICDGCSFPTKRQIEEYDKELCVNGSLADYFWVMKTRKRAPMPPRKSAGFGIEAKSRPAHDKVQQMLELMLFKLGRFFGIDKKESLSEQSSQLVEYISRVNKPRDKEDEEEQTVADAGDEAAVDE
jgi:hypothetical protein